MITTRRIDEVKKALECCVVRDPDDRKRCPDCPYRDPEAYCANRLMADALATIEELSDTIDALTGGECEECKVEPGTKEVIYDDVHKSVYCPSCNNRLAGLTHSGAVALETEETPNYCWMCGQAVKW